MKQINLGIIGFGNEGRLLLLNSRKLKTARIAAVADLSEKARSRARSMGIPNVFEKYDDLLKEDDIDGVIISLPNFLHQEAAVKSD